MKNINFMAIIVLFFSRFLVDINNVSESNKISSGEKSYQKYFIGYVCDDYKIKPLHIILPKTSAYVRSYDGQTKLMYFFTEDDDFTEKYNTIWDEISIII